MKSIPKPKPPLFLNTESSKRGPNQPAAEVAQQKELDKHLDFARQLSHDVGRMRDLYRQQDALLAEAEAQAIERSKIANAMHEAQGNTERRGVLERQLQNLNQ